VYDFKRFQIVEVTFKICWTRNLNTTPQTDRASDAATKRKCHIITMVTTLWRCFVIYKLVLPVINRSIKFEVPGATTSTDTKIDQTFTKGHGLG